MSRLSPTRLATLCFAFFSFAQAAAQFSTVINIPPDPNPFFLNSNTQLNLSNGGTLPSSLSTPFQAGNPSGTSTNVEVNILGGTVGEYFEAYAGSTVNVSGGKIGRRFTLFQGSAGNISGGEFDRSFLARSGSDLSITGGLFGFGFAVLSGTEADVSGGQFSPRFQASAGSDLDLFGGEFQLNGAPLNSATVTLGPLDVLAGTLQDGAPFVFSPVVSDELVSVDLVPTTLPTTPTAPIIVDSNNAPPGLRPGQTLILQEGGSLGRTFSTVGARLRIEDGEAGFDLEAHSSIIDFLGGTIGVVQTNPGGESGGSFDVYSGTQANISGGSVEGRTRVGPGGILNVSDGLPSDIIAFSGSTINIAGGGFGDIRADSGTVINIFGTSFSYDGFPLSGLEQPGDTLVFLQRDGLDLDATLPNGSDSITIELNDGPGTVSSYVEPGATLRLHIVLPGDFDGDADVDINDLLAYQRGEAVYPVGPSSLAQWQTNLGENTAGDIDADGDVDVADGLAIQRLGSVDDLAAWLDRFGFGDNLLSAATAVPEPAAATLYLIAAWLALLARPTESR